MWEFEGLFDAEINPDDQTMLSEFWRDEKTGIKLGRMGYRRRTTKAGSRIEAEVYPVFGRNDRKKARAARKNITPEAQQKLNVERSARHLIQLVEENFSEKDLAMGLNYQGTPPDDDRVQKDLRNFLNKVKRLREKRGLPELKYIYAIGGDEMPSPGYSGKRPHVHLILSGGLSREELEEIWKKGNPGHGATNCDRLQPNEDGLEGIARYLMKQRFDRPEKKNAKKWSRSRNLKAPWKSSSRTSDCKISNGRVKRIAFDFLNHAKETMEKLYPGYTLQKTQVNYSDVVDGVYIRCILRKIKGGRQHGTV